jgi:energy-converting hydrogenase Eha subunit G
MTTAPLYLKSAFNTYKILLLFSARKKLKEEIVMPGLAVLTAEIIGLSRMLLALWL